jgi:hypothetical protein
MAFSKKNAGSDNIHTGTEAWNIAQFFTGFSIALPLKELNDLEDIARFGSLAMDDDLAMSNDVVDKRRAEAVKRYWQKLKQIVYDTLFKVKKIDREDAEKISKWLQKAPKYFDGLISADTNNVDGESHIQINEEFLATLLDELVEKKQMYLFILDRTGLIFRESDEFDVDKFMQDYEQGG